MIVIDIEASGLDPKTAGVVSIGAVDFEHPTRTFYAEPRLWDGAKCDPDALMVNGFSEEECRDPSRPELNDVMLDFLTWIKPIEERTLVGQNPSFDRDFLNAAFGRSSVSWHFSYRTIDLHTVAYIDHIKRNIPMKVEHFRTSMNLDTILAYVGLPKEPQPHNALNGAKLEAEALSRILFGKNLLVEYSNHPIPEMFIRA